MKTKFAIGCFIQWYEVDMIHEYFNSLLTAIDYYDKSSVIIDVTLSTNSELEQPDGDVKNISQPIVDQIREIYGNDYNIELEDPFSSGTKQKLTIDLSQIEHKEVDYSLFENRKNEFDFELPNSKRVVTFRLMTHSLEKEIQAELKANNKTFVRTGIDKELTTRLKHIIIAVDGESGRATINNFVDNELFAVDSRSLRTYIKKISPDVDMTFTFVSDATGEVKEMDIPMDVSFFWPES